MYPSLWNLTTYTFQLGQGLILQTESCLLRFLSNTIQNDLVVKVQAKTCLLNAGPPGLYYLGFCDWFQLDNGCNLPDLFWFFHLGRTCPSWSGERAMLWPLWVWYQLGCGVFKFTDKFIHLGYFNKIKLVNIISMKVLSYTNRHRKARTYKIENYFWKMREKILIDENHF